MPDLAASSSGLDYSCTRQPDFRDMPEDHMDLQDWGSGRRLATILVLDVVGSSRWMEADEAGTLAAINQLLGDMLTPAVNRHRGRVVKQMGDGALVEFASPVEAVLCAAELQAELAQLRATAEPGEVQLQIRIG